MNEKLLGNLKNALIKVNFLKREKKEIDPIGDLNNALIKVDSLKREKKEIEYRIQKLEEYKIGDDLYCLFSNSIYTCKPIIDPALANQMALLIFGDITNLIKRSIKDLEDQIKKINSEMQQIEHAIKGIFKEMAD